MNKIIAIQLNTINVNHTETREIELISNTTKNTKTEKQKQKRLVTTSKKWTFIESDYSKETQLSILTDIQNNTDNIKNPNFKTCVLQQINQKINGYKNQDIIKKLYLPTMFITFNRIIELLIKCNLDCHYCKKTVNVLYEVVREPMQWTLDRIDNNYGHNNDNVFIACLSCNLKRKTIYHERYVFTKQCEKVIKLE